MNHHGITTLSLALLAASTGALAAEPTGGPRLDYFGRSSFRIVTSSGFVVYVDPYAPGDYSLPADLVLSSHGHGDHNQVGKVALKADATIVAAKDAVQGFSVETISEGEERSFGPVTVHALPAANKNHPRGLGLGFLLSFDGIVLYYSGDTSRLPEMEGWKTYSINYALICSDGFYNMGVTEAADSALAMGAKRIVPIHTSKNGMFDEAVARSAKYSEVIVARPGDSIALLK